MGKIGFTWDRRGKRGMPVSGIGEDLAHGAWWSVAGAVLAGGDRDAEDGRGAVHAGVGGGRGGPRTEGGAGGDVLERGRDGVCAEDVEGVAGLLVAGGHRLGADGRLGGRAGRGRGGWLVVVDVAGARGRVLGVGGPGA